MEQALYNTIGDNYNQTRTADPYIAEMLYKFAVSDTEGLYLDIGCGTGNYTIALSDKGVKMCGIDPSQKMLEVAQARNSNIRWQLGIAEAIPAQDNMFDGITGMLTLHHWKDFDKAFSELYRVLKKGAGMVFFTSTPEQMEGYWLNHYFPKMMKESSRHMPSSEQIENSALKAGFEILAQKKYFISNELKDHFLYVGKNRPELYFDESIRKGISSFAALSNSEEVNNGLLQLQADISEGNLLNVINDYENSKGDYIFMRFKKHSPLVYLTITSCHLQ